MFRRIRPFLLCFSYMAALGQGLVVPQAAEASAACSMTACTCKHDKHHSAKCCCMAMGQLQAKRLAALQAAERAADSRPWMKDGCSHERDEPKTTLSLKPHLVPQGNQYEIPVLASLANHSHASCLTEHPEPPSPVPD